MKFELFTPAWKSENDQRRAKALDRMKEEKLLAIVRNPSQDDRLNQVRREAVQRLSPKALAEVALDAKVDTYLRNMAICRVDDEQVLLAYLRDPTAWRPGDAMERMRTGKLIMENAMNLSAGPHGVAAWRCHGAHAHREADHGERHEPGVLLDGREAAEQPGG